MPKMVTIGPAAGFKVVTKGQEKAVQIKAFTLIEAKGDVRVSYQTAIQNIKLSGGMYEIKTDLPTSEVKADIEVGLNDRSLQDLKVMMLSLGIETKKQMKKADVVGLIQAKLDETDITEDEE